MHPVAGVHRRPACLCSFRAWSSYSVLMVGSDGVIPLLSLCLRVFMLEASEELFHSFKNTILRAGKRTQWTQVLPLSQMTRVSPWTHVVEGEKWLPQVML